MAMRQSLLYLAASAPWILLAIHFLSGRSQLGDIIDMLWPLYLAAGLGYLTAWAVLRTGPDWAARATAGAALLVLILAQPWSLRPVGQGHAIIDAPRSPHFVRIPRTLRVVSFNVWASNEDLTATRDYLLHGDFEVLALQEVGLRTRALPSDLAAIYPHQVTCGRGVYLMSKIAFEAEGCVIPSPGTYRSQGVYGDITWQGERVRVISVHIARPMEMSYRRPQLARLYDFVASFDGPTILAGDFNTTPNGRAMAEIERELAPLVRRTSGYFTWPSQRITPWPLLSIDHVFSSEELCPRLERVGPHLGSDHRPVVMGFERCADRVRNVSSKASKAQADCPPGL